MEDWVYSVKKSKQQQIPKFLIDIISQNICCIKFHYFLSKYSKFLMCTVAITHILFNIV